VNTTDNLNFCKSPEAIDEYIKDISVDYWTVENRMDLTEFNSEPYKREMRILGQQILKKDISERDILMTENHHYEVYKDYLYPSKPKYIGEFFKI